VDINVLNAPFLRKNGHIQNKCFSLHGFPNNTTNIFQSNKVEPQFANEEFQDYLRLKSSGQIHSFTQSSLSKACISQTLECQSPWISDSSASDHISSNVSLFSSISLPKIPYVITLANGSKFTST